MLQSVFLFCQSKIILQVVWQFIFHWNIKQIPGMVQWKSGASGDYALAIEPVNCGFGGRAGAEQILAPMQTHINEIRFCIADGADAIAALEESCRQLLTNK